MRWLWPTALMVVITLSSAGPGPRLRGIENILGYDKIGHCAVFGLLATLIYRARPAHGHDRRWLWQAGLLAAACGIADELHQHFNPTRSFDLGDMAANTIGVVLALFVYRHWHHYRQTLEFRLWPFGPGRTP